MGRQYEYDEWLEFLTGSDQPQRVKKLQGQFEIRIEDLVDQYLPDDADYPDIPKVAYLSFATLTGAGVGLWEEREPWHQMFGEVVESDAESRRLAQAIEDSARRR